MVGPRFADDSPRTFIENEIPIIRPENESMSVTLDRIEDQLKFQLAQLKTSRRSSLSDPTSESKSSKKDIDITEYGEWRYIWGRKATSYAINDKGIMNIGKVIGKEFILDENIKQSSKLKSIKSNFNYRIDYDELKGKHFNTTEYFEDEIKQESSHKFKKPVEKAYLYSSLVKYLYRKYDKEPMPNSNELNKYILESKPEPYKLFIEHTSQALLSGHTMDHKIASEVLYLFDKSKDKNVVEYFKQFGNALRLVIDCARHVYLKNEGRPALDLDDYNTVALHYKVSTYIRPIWKFETIEFIKKLVAIDAESTKIFKLLETNNSINKEEKKLLISQLDFLKDNREELTIAFPNTLGGLTLIHEVYHAFHGYGGRLEIMEDLLKTFDKKDAIFKELWEILLLNSEDLIFSAINDLKNLIYIPQKRTKYFEKHKNDTEETLADFTKFKLKKIDTEISDKTQEKSEIADTAHVTPGSSLTNK